MQVGCGFRIKAIKNRDYVYFWHYEDRGGRSRQVYAYMGPQRSPATARRLAEAIESYYGAASDALRRSLGQRRSEIATLRE